MTSRMQPVPATDADPEAAGKRFRRVSLEEAMGTATGPRAERTALRLRAFETQHEVLEHFYGGRVGVAVALIQAGERERLEWVCGPDAQPDQRVEELLFRA